MPDLTGEESVKKLIALLVLSCGGVETVAVEQPRVERVVQRATAPGFDLCTY